MHVSKVMSSIKKRDERDRRANAPEAKCPSNSFEVGDMKMCVAFAFAKGTLTLFKQISGKNYPNLQRAKTHEIFFKIY